MDFKPYYHEKVTTGVLDQSIKTLNFVSIKCPIGESHRYSVTSEGSPEPQINNVSKFVHAESTSH